MPTAVKIEVTQETIIQAIKSMKKSARQVFLEDLISATSPSTFKAFARLGETLNQAE